MANTKKAQHRMYKQASKAKLDSLDAWSKAWFGKQGNPQQLPKHQGKSDAVKAMQKLGLVPITFGDHCMNRKALKANPKKSIMSVMVDAEGKVAPKLVEYKPYLSEPKLPKPSAGNKPLAGIHPKWMSLDEPLLPPLPPIADAPTPVGVGSIVSPYAYFTPSDPKTQKARGINLLRAMPYMETGLLKPPGEIHILPSGEMKMTAKDFPLFARPCPKTPRHGFVDSRKVGSFEELFLLWAQAQRADPEAEIVLMQPLTAAMSAVATNAGVTWGLGNAGVTSTSEWNMRHNAPVLIPAPVSSDNFRSGLAKLMEKGTSQMKELCPTSAYAEIVDHRGRARLVQLRDGPEQSARLNWTPKAVKVADVMRFDGFDEGDLLEWEKHLYEVTRPYHEPGNDPAELVLWAPGMPLSSHYAVHAIQMGMTVLTKWDHCPVKGDTITPVETAPEPWSRDNLRFLSSVIFENHRRHYFSDTQDGLAAIAATGVAMTHVVSQWPAEDKLLTLAGISFDALARLGLAACVGEVRHGSHEIAHSDEYVNFPWPDTLQESLSQRQRDLVYREFLMPMPYATQLKFLRLALETFKLPGWSKSYGGPAWADVAEASIGLVEALEHFTSHQPTTASFAKIVMAANQLVHVSHNGGKALTKWCNVDLISNHPVLGFCNSFTGCIMTQGGMQFRIFEASQLAEE